MRKITTVVFPLAQRAATAITRTLYVNTSGRIVGFLRVTANEGTNETLDVKFQDSPDGEAWYDISGATFTQATGVTTQRLAVTVPTGPFVRLVATLGGSGDPKFTYELAVVIEDIT